MKLSSSIFKRIQDVNIKIDIILHTLNCHNPGWLIDDAIDIMSEHKSKFSKYLNDIESITDQFTFKTRHYYTKLYDMSSIVSLFWTADSFSKRLIIYKVLTEDDVQLDFNILDFLLENTIGETQLHLIAKCTGYIRYKLEFETVELAISACDLVSAFFPIILTGNSTYTHSAYKQKLKWFRFWYHESQEELLNGLLNKVNEILQIK